MRLEDGDVRIQFLHFSKLGVLLIADTDLIVTSSKPLELRYAKRQMSLSPVFTCMIGVSQCHLFHAKYRIGTS